MKRSTNFKAAATAVAAFAVLLSLVCLPSAQAQLPARAAASAQAPAAQLSATLYGNFDYAFEGRGAWVGHALVSIGGGPAKTAEFADRNTSIAMRANGAIYGTETISVHFLDGSGDFQIMSQFEGTPAPTPGLYNLHEVGAITNGTGDYAGISGVVAVEGPFMFPDPRITTGAPPWIATVHGSIQGYAAGQPEASASVLSRP